MNSTLINTETAVDWHGQQNETTNYTNLHEFKITNIKKELRKKG